MGIFTSCRPGEKIEGEVMMDQLIIYFPERGTHCCGSKVMEDEIWRQEEGMMDVRSNSLYLDSFYLTRIKNILRQQQWIC